MSQDSRLRQFVSAVAAVVVLGLFAAACGSSGGSDNSATASSDVTVKAASEPTAGGAVKFAVEAESDGFNPTTNRWAVSVES